MCCVGFMATGYYYGVSVCVCKNRTEMQRRNAGCRFGEVFVINGCAFAYLIQSCLLDGASKCKCKLLKTDGA